MSDSAIPNQDVLACADAQFLSYVAWAQEQIAEKAYVVQLPPKPWAGRDDMVNCCAQHFTLTDLGLCGRVIDMAVMSLWTDRQDDPTHFMKQTMLLRLKAIRQLIVSAIKEGRREQTFKYVPLSELEESQKPPHLRGRDDPTVLIEFKLKEKRYHGTEMSAVDKLLAVERLIAELDGLFGDSSKKGAGNVVQTIFEELDRLSKKNAAELDDTSNVSLAHRAKNRKLIAPPAEIRVTSVLGAAQAEPELVKPVTRKRGVKIGDVLIEVNEEDEDPKDGDDAQGE